MCSPARVVSLRWKVVEEVLGFSCERRGGEHGGVKKFACLIVCFLSPAIFAEESGVKVDEEVESLPLNGFFRPSVIAA